MVTTQIRGGQHSFPWREIPVLFNTLSFHTTSDGIPYFLLKKCANSLAPILTEIFRSILDSGQIPSLWRKSYIIPIHKKREIGPEKLPPYIPNLHIVPGFRKDPCRRISSFFRKKKIFYF